MSPEEMKIRTAGFILAYLPTGQPQPRNPQELYCRQRAFTLSFVLEPLHTCGTSDASGDCTRLGEEPSPNLG